MVTPSNRFLKQTLEDFSAAIARTLLFCQLKHTSPLSNYRSLIHLVRFQGLGLVYTNTSYPMRA